MFVTTVGFYETVSSAGVADLFRFFFKSFFT
ncbi:hypothetical protein ZOD2009_12055 [Haladaptatus paucihalophilus DX253]|uniref:Uncharacterized protein n=1 Tax=Haladaptatus paucihalophilus DX253 TaxID=797209 RepID=E7QUD1_HALPU|nr:hypothetical protein ZOD2009_12055 [Haladaptatus paucihalophilus DX253]